MTASNKLFREDRIAEIIHFVDEMEKEYREKCSPSEWNSILQAVGAKLATIEFNRRVGPKLGLSLPKKDTREIF